MSDSENKTAPEEDTMASRAGDPKAEDAEMSGKQASAALNDMVSPDVRSS
jgi:hypothetical protein